MLIFLSLSQSPLRSLSKVQPIPEKPSTSPRSIASRISVEPGYPSTTLNFVPTSLFAAFGNTTSVASAPEPPTIALLLSASCSVFTLAVCHRAQVVYSTLAVPIQLNWRGSKFGVFLAGGGPLPPGGPGDRERGPAARRG